MKVEVFPRRNWRGKRSWFFRIRGKNGETLCQSEAYRNRGDAWDTALLLRASLFDATVEEVSR